MMLEEACSGAVQHIVGSMTLCAGKQFDTYLCYTESAGMEEDTTLVLPSEEQDQLVQAVEQGMDLDSSTGTSGGAVAAGVAGSSTATSPGQYATLGWCRC
jgi:hypothetical protein